MNITITVNGQQLLLSASAAVGITAAGVPTPLKCLDDGSLVVSGSVGGGGAGADRELVVTTYVAISAFTGASIGDIITQTQVLDVSSTPTTVASLWRNQTTAADLAGAPASANISIVGRGGATETTLALLLAQQTTATNELLSIDNKLPVALDNGRLAVVDPSYDPIFGKTLVGTARDKFRDEFFSFDTVNNWDLIQTGSGQTVTVDGIANGARYLNVATGITTSSETIIQSKNSFKLPLKLAFGLSMSQRIVNQEVFLELVSVDGSGNVETDSTFPSTNLNNATNAIGFKFDSTTAINAMYFTRGYGVSELITAGVSFVVSTAATGSSPNFIPAGVWELNGDMEEAVFNSRAIDSLGAVSALFKRTQNLPDPSKNYKIRFRIRNLAVAPASTTDVRLHFVRVLDTTRFTIDWARHMGRSTDIGDSMPVAVTFFPTNTSFNLGQVGGQSVIVSQPNGATNRALTLVQGSAVSQVDQNATAFAGTGRVPGTIVASAAGSGAVVSAEINVTALTLGAATAVLFVLQESRGGTNFTDIWVSEPVTTTGIVSVPAVPVAGRRRWAAHSVGGASTTVTATITTLELPSGYPLQRQYREVYAATAAFASIINNAAQAASTFGATTVLAATTQATSAFVVEGLKNITATMVLAGTPTVTTQPIVSIEISNDLTNWWPTAATMTAAGAGVYSATLTDRPARFARLRVTTAAAYSAGAYTLSGVSLYGTN